MLAKQLWIDEYTKYQQHCGQLGKTVKLLTVLQVNVTMLQVT